MNRIRQLREEMHMTQVRLSTELEVSQETISAYEKEKHYPSFLQLVKMSKLFHASIDYIMGMSNIRNPAPSPDDQRAACFTSLAQQLDGIQKEMAIAYMRGLIDMKRNL